MRFATRSVAVRVAAPPEIPRCALGLLSRTSCYTDLVRNVTLTLPEETIRLARHLAVEKGVSLSRLLSEYLEEVVVRSDRYNDARRKALVRMKKAVPLGLRKSPSWRRDQLHER